MPAGLAVDWIHERLYWTDSATSRIEFSSLDGTIRKVLFHQSVHKPHSIVTHPEQSTIFWSDWGDQHHQDSPPRIERAFMDGSGRHVIVSSLLSMPTGLQIDYPADRLYWVDTLQNMIECSNLDGSSRFIIVTDQVRHPVSLTIFEDNLYWSSINSAHIQTVSKLTGRNVSSTLVEQLLRLGFPEFDLEIKVLHPLRQPDAQTKTPCHSSPCSHLCLPNNVSYRCSCPFGYNFEAHSYHKCQIDSNSLLLYTHRNDVRAVALAKSRYISDGDILFNDFHLAHVLPIARITFAVSLDYDHLSSTLFWSDLGNKSISRAKWSFTDSHQQESIINDSLESPSGIAFDWAAGNLYWVDTGRSVIEVARANGSFRSLLVWRSLDQPRDIVLDPVRALMFWSQWSNQTANIERSGMDGSYRVILHSLNMTRPHGLALDHPSRRICWADSVRAQIECSFYDGSDRRSVVSKNVQYPFAVAIAGDFIYFSDLHQRNVQQANKLTGEMQSILFEETDSLMDIVVLHQNRSALNHEFAFTNGCNQARCSHLCLLSPQPPGFRCACPTGIFLLDDGHTCADDMTKYLIFTTRKAIRRISLHSEHHFDVNVAIQRHMENAFVLDVHSNSKTVFWSDTNENAIFRANMLDGRAEPVVRFGLLGSNGLAIDEVNSKLYWSDAGRKRIEVANLDGSYRRVLISENLDSPRAIAVNHKSGHMVFVDWGSQARIERADMDGNRRALLVSKDLGWPNGIVITENERIVWADSKTHSIEMVDLNGANRQKLAEELPSPYGVALMDGWLYFTDWHSKTINRIYLFSSGGDVVNGEQAMPAKVEIFARSLSNLVDIRAVDRQKSQAAFLLQHNMCQISNGGCSHLCLRNSAPGYACLCPTGLTLLADGKTCNSDISKQLLLAFATNLRRISLDSSDYHDVYLPLNNLVDVLSIDYHFSTGQIFYIDTASKDIRSLTLANLSQFGSTEKSAVSNQVVIFNERSQPRSLAVDWIARNLYWSDHERHLIEVARLDGSSRKVLIDLDLNQPKSLQLLPELGLMFWIDTTIVQRIERAFLDGSGRVTLLRFEGGQMNALAVERGNQERGEMARLFWTNGLLQRIESIQIDGTGRLTVLAKGLTSPTSIAVLGDFIFYSDSYNKVIERTNWKTKEDYRLVAENIDALREIKIMSRSQQSIDMVMSATASNVSAINPCAIDNGACSHLCLFRPHGYICACPSYPDPRPCSTVPGETYVALQPAGETPTGEDDDSFFNASFLPTKVTPNRNHAQPDDSNGLLESSNGNESLRLKELADLCQESFNMTRCNSSRFAFDDHIIQVAYVLALILLSAAVLVCAILTFFCKRKLMEEEFKLSKFEGNNLPRLESNSIAPLPSSGTLHRRPFTGSTIERSYAPMLRLNNVPPPPPPPFRCPSPFMEPHNFVDYELSQPPHLWFSPHGPGPLEREPPYQAARFQWANTLPRHSNAAGNQHHRSAMNSPYLASTSRGTKENAHMTYLCLESSKLETDI